jgi:hypothetical protein
MIIVNIYLAREFISYLFDGVQLDVENPPPIG